MVMVDERAQQPLGSISVAHKTPPCVPSRSFCHQDNQHIVRQDWLTQDLESLVTNRHDPAHAPSTCLQAPRLL